MKIPLSPSPEPSQSDLAARLEMMHQLKNQKLASLSALMDRLEAREERTEVKIKDWLSEAAGWMENAKGMWQS